MRLVAKHGGKFLVRPDCRVDRLEGDPLIKTGMVVIEFPDRASAQAWYGDPVYQPLKGLRQLDLTLHLIIVDGLAD